MTAPVTQNYFDQIAVRESGAINGKPLNSSTRYATTNPYDYLGKYQLGTQALIDAGLYSRPENKIKFRC
jgi:hypothetical protein